MTNTAPTIAIFDASDDTVDLLVLALNEGGFRTVTGHLAEVKRGATDFLAFIAEHDPQAIIWDIAPPYDRNWVFFELLRASTALAGRGVVLTTTHKAHLDQMAGQDTGAIEIIGKPYDLDAIVEAVRRALPTQNDDASSTAS